MYFVSSFGHPSSLVDIASAHTGLRIRGRWRHNFPKYITWVHIHLKIENMHACMSYWYSSIFITTLNSLCFNQKYETANWSLRQGDEEVNKRIKQKYIYLCRFIFFYKFNCMYWSRSTTTGRSAPLIGLLLWLCCHFKCFLSKVGSKRLFHHAPPYIYCMLCFYAFECNFIIKTRHSYKTATIQLLTT